MFRIVIALLMLWGVQPHNAVRHYGYDFDTESQIYLKGTSNVNSFQCYATEKLPSGIFSASQSSNGKEIKFFNANLLVKVYSLDCRNKFISKDLFHTLKASLYPYIAIQLKSATLESKQPDGKLKYLVEMTMTLTNVTQTHYVEMYVDKVGDSAFRIVGSHSIKLSNYKIKQPTAMMGLVVVNDDINILFDVIANLTVTQN